MSRPESITVVNALPEGRLKNLLYVQAILNGARDAARTGPLGGYPLMNVRITILDAEEHPTDSSEIAFESAASLAVQRAPDEAGPVLLEPIMKVEVVTPEEYFGAINGDLMSRRVTITNTHQRGKNHVIDAEAPLATMFGYSTAVRSLSQGRAAYSMEPLRYESMPQHEVQRVLGIG